MKMIRWDDFKQPVSASAISDVVSALGELSRWMLNNKILSAACEIDLTEYWSTPPTLPVSIGCCWMLTVNADRETYRWIKPSFLLPLIWRCDSDHGSLPDALRDLANDVLAVTKQNSGDPQAKWGLHLFSESGASDDVRFPECDPGQFNFPSGWVALAAGLMAAQRGYPPQGNVWATGCWDNSAGVTEVSGVSQKIDVINEYVTQNGDTIKEAFLFVPPANVIQANRYITETIGASKQSVLSIIGFPSPQLNPTLALSSLLALSRIQPPPDAPIEAQVAFYKSTLEVDQALAERYYEKTLYPKIVLQCRERLPLMPSPPERLVTVVSHSFELVKLAVEVFQIKECVMLYTVPTDESNYTRQITDMTAVAESTKADCEKLGCTVFDESFSYDAESETLREELGRTLSEKVSKHFGGYAPETIAYDMVSAHKLFNYAFDHAVARPGSLMYWLDHIWIKKAKRQLPLTERFVVWRAGEPWGKTISS